MVMMMEPLTILGALLGSFLNRIVPEFVLILLLAIVLAATASRTVNKGLNLWAKESEQNREKRKDKNRVTNEAARHLVPNISHSIRASQSDTNVRSIEDGGSPTGDGSSDNGASSSFQVGDRVRVRDSMGERWRSGEVTGTDKRTGRLRVRKDGHDKAFLYNMVEAENFPNVPDPRFEATSTSVTSSSPPSSLSSMPSLFARPLLAKKRLSASCSAAALQCTRSEGEGSTRASGSDAYGDVLTSGDRAVLGIIDKYQPLGTTATASALVLFVPMPYPLAFKKGENLICQRSNGEWTHAKVHAFESWPPEGGTLTLQVDKFRRKVLDLSKRRHMQRVRVSASKVDNDRKQKGLLLFDNSNDDARAGFEVDSTYDESRWDVLGAESPSERRKEIEEEERHHSSWKMGLLFVSWVGVVAIDLTKELTSCGSIAYFMTTALTLPWVILFFFGYRTYLLKRQAEKIALAFQVSE
jgi:hypothetical protein